MPPRRRAARRTARRTTRRTVHRTHRRIRRRRILVGGAVLLVAGGTAAAIKLSKSDADRIEQSTGTPPEEMTEEELTQAMRDLGIQSIELTDEDQAIIQNETGGAAPAAPQSSPSAPPASDDAYLDELEKLADLRDRGIITDEDFEAKKKKLLGI